MAHESILSIEVLGAGCPNCTALFERTKAAAAALGIEAEVRYSTDIGRIAELNVLRTPVIIVNGVPLVAGSLPDLNEIKALLTNVRSAA